MLTVSQISKAILVLLGVSQREEWLQPPTTRLKDREKENE